MTSRVVVTGMGTINPLGNSIESTWQNAINGISGVGKIANFDASKLRVQIACEVKDFKPEDYLSFKDVRRLDRVELFASGAAKLAIEQSGIRTISINPYRIGVIISSAIGGLNTIHETYTDMTVKGPNRISPFVIPMLMTNGSAAMVAIDYGFQGPCFSIASGCASSSDAIGLAWSMIRNGELDAAITGGTEATINEFGIATFDRLGAMSRRNENFQTTPQPFDINRDGLVMGEGSAVLILENENLAKKRGADILGELVGYASNADAFHITAPADDGVAGAEAITSALKVGKINPEDVDYINAHGTATPLNDISETNAIKKSFKNQAYNIPISSTKSMTGHMMGATAALEAIFCVLAIREGIIPPTINYQTPDPECDLDYVPNKARELSVRTAMSNAFGFGGHNSVLIFKAY